MTEYKDWQVTLSFRVPAGDEDGAWTTALFEAALKFASASIAGMTARADTELGRVWLAFSVVDTTEELALEIARGLEERVLAEVLSGDGISVTDVCV
jgi:hypothetical protein